MSSFPPDSGFVFFSTDGVGLAVAILLDATIVRCVLVPSTMELLGDDNEWALAWAERIWSPTLRDLGSAASRHAARLPAPLRIEMAVEEVPETLIEVDAIALVDEAMHFAGVAIRLDDATSALDRALHHQQMLLVHAPIFGAVGQEDGNLDVIGVPGWRNRLQVVRIVPAVADQFVVRRVEEQDTPRRRSGASAGRLRRRNWRPHETSPAF